MSNQRRAVAQFLLDEAVAAGIKLATDGREELDALIPFKLDREVRRCFERSLAAYKAEVIRLIREKHEEREGSQ